MEAATITQVLSDEAVRVVHTSRRSDEALPVLRGELLVSGRLFAQSRARACPLQRDELFQLD